MNKWGQASRCENCPHLVTPVAGPGGVIPLGDPRLERGLYSQTCDEKPRAGRRLAWAVTTRSAARPHGLRQLAARADGLGHLRLGHKSVAAGIEQEVPSSASRKQGQIDPLCHLVTHLRD